MWKLTLCCIFFIRSVLGASLQNDASLLDGRIMGGHEVAITDYPYQASVQYEGTHRCGGAIIGRAWVITAAHCFDNSPPQPSGYSVRVGTSFLNIGGEVLDVMYIVSHPRYSNVTYDYDIALIRLLDPVSLSEYAQILPLPWTIDYNPQGFTGKVTGWGAMAEGGRPTDVLRAVVMLVMPAGMCNNLYPDLITRRMICVGFWSGGVGACAGDDGGPLVVNSALAGIMSWRNGCGEPQQPGVFTNVAVLNDWIAQITGI